MLPSPTCCPSTSCSCRLQVDPSPRCVDGPYPDVDRVAEPHPAPGLAADQHRALLVDVVPVATEAPHRQEALASRVDAVPTKPDEDPGADHAGHLTLELLVPPVFAEFSLEQEGEA